MDNNSFRTMYDDFFGSSLLTDEYRRFIIR